MNLKVLTVIGMLIFMTACADDTGIGPKPTPFVGGDKGLAMSFVEGAPPDSVVDNGQFPFQVVLKIENKGEHDVAADDGYVQIVGINPVDFGQTAADLKMDIPEDIRGASKGSEGDIILGDTIIMEFPKEFNYLPDIQGNFDGPRIRPELCYNYENTASAYICVKSDLLRDSETEQICKIAGTKSTFNSGGPIHVTELKESALGTSKIQLTFKIAHVGDSRDRFFKQDTECDYKVTNLNKNKVWVEVTSDINGNKASCSGLEEPNADNSGGYITLYESNPRTIVCTQDLTGVDGVFEDLFTIGLRYRYNQFIEKQILVKDISIT